MPTKVTIENGELVTRTPIDKKGNFAEAKSGKNLFLATTGGFEKTGLTFKHDGQDKEIKLSLMAMIEK